LKNNPLKDIRGQVRVVASPRSEYPSRTIDVKIPQDYHQKLKKSWLIYNTDPLINFLIEQTLEYAVSGFEWQSEDDNPIWNNWSRNINKQAPNIMPGLDEVMKWIMR